jgi:hypothetical protein
MKAFTMFPKTSVAMMAIASRHPQRRRLNQPVPATAKSAPSKKKRNPDCFPERRKLPVRKQIHGPHAVENRAAPD